jgi:hypothetical protein
MDIKQTQCHDVDGNVLQVNDRVVFLDIEDLDGNPPRRGDVLIVTDLLDVDSSYVRFVDEQDVEKSYEFFSHRVLKVNQIQLYDTDFVVLDIHKKPLRFHSDENIIIYSDLMEARADRRDEYEVVKCTELPDSIKEEIILQLQQVALDTALYMARRKNQ